MGLLIFYLVLALTLSFLCSIWEAVILSVTSSYIQVQEKEGHKIAMDLVNFEKNIDKPIAAILTLNTFAHTIGAAGVGAQAQNIWGEEWLSLISVILTLLILIFSEIIPKTIGASYWQVLTPFTVRCVKVLLVLLFPIVAFTQFITRKMRNGDQRSVLTRAEFSAMTELGLEQGIIRQEESEIIQNLLVFNKITVENIMTPRTVIFSAQENTTIHDLYENTENLRHSRIPIYKDNLDNISGFILKDDLLENIIEENGHLPLKKISRDVIMINEDKRIPELFKFLMSNQAHIAIVTDEFGGTSGLVTMEDVIETLLGMEIMDEFDSIDDMQALARQNWKKRAKKLGLITEDSDD